MMTPAFLGLNMMEKRQKINPNDDEKPTRFF